MKGKQERKEVQTYRFRVHFRTPDGVDHVEVVEARHEFEAVQLAGAFGQGVYVFSVVNLDAR